jgi:hypothetical protein
MEKHYVFKSLLEDNITRAPLEQNAEDYTEMHVPLGAHFQGQPGGFLLTVDAVVLNCVTQFSIVWRVGTFPFLPMSKYRRKARYVTVVESLFLKNISTANARCSSNQRCMMTEGFKPLYPVMCFTAPRTKMSAWH